jgi:uncharacterized protein YndB with AHSA1/START domain
MGNHEASTTVDVAPNIVYDRLSDLDRLPEYLPWMTGLRRTAGRPAEAQGPETRRPHQAVHEEIDVAAGDAHQEGWIDVIDEDRVLRWGAAGPHEYEGELQVGFVSDGTSRLTVRVHTTSEADVDAELERALAEIKTALELEARSVSGEPEA